MFKKLAKKCSLTDVVIRNQRNSIEYSFLNVVRLNTLFFNSFPFLFYLFRAMAEQKVRWKLFNIRRLYFSRDLTFLDGILVKIQLLLFISWFLFFFWNVQVHVNLISSIFTQKISFLIFSAETRSSTSPERNAVQWPYRESF